jgi:hypothetical protein
MADKKQAPGAGEVAPTVAEYKKSQARVRELVEKRRALERQLVRTTVPLSRDAVRDQWKSDRLLTLCARDLGSDRGQHSTEGDGVP